MEDTKAQVKFWEMLNVVMQKHGLESVQFRGFMADEAGANWAAVRRIYGSGDDVPMEGRERSCLFHFKDSLKKHTDQCIIQDKRGKHISLCEDWRLAVDMTDANAKYNIVRAFWRSGGAYSSQIPALEAWLSWWHIRYSHWGRYMDAVRVCMILLYVFISLFVIFSEIVIGAPLLGRWLGTMMLFICPR